MANRARKYVVGMAGGFPLPLSVADITAVLDAHPSPLPRDEIDSYIFALDAEFMEAADGKPKPQEDVGSAWVNAVSQINGE